MTDDACSGMDLTELVPKFCENHWTPWQVTNQITLAQLFILWGPSENKGTFLIPPDVLEDLNRVRREMGIPEIVQE